MLHVRRFLRTPVLHVSLTPYILLGLHVRCALYAHVPCPALLGIVTHAPYNSEAFLRYAPCVLRAVIHLMPKVLQVSLALHAIMHLKTCGFVSRFSYAFGNLAI